MRTIVLFLLFLLCFNSMAQSNKKTGTLTLNPTDEISFMKGTWKGEGWIIINRERKG